MTETNNTFEENQKSANSLRIDQRDFIQKILIIILFALVLTVLWQGSEVILLIFAGLLLAIFFRSLSELLSKYTPLPHSLALIVVLLLIIGLISLGIWFLAPAVQTQFTDLTDQLPAVYEQAKTQLSQYPLGQKLVNKMPSAQQFVLRQRII